MNINSFLCNKSDNNKSVTTTAFVVGVIICNFKFLVSGMTIMGVQFSSLSGVEYGAALAALGGVYILRRKHEGDK